MAISIKKMISTYCLFFLQIPKRHLLSLERRKNKNKKKKKSRKKLMHKRCKYLKILQTKKKIIKIVISIKKKMISTY